jgi:hypothetical protein
MKHILDAYTSGALTFEQAMDALTEIGHAPALIFDDDGRWAMSGSGFGPAPSGEPVAGGWTHVFEKEDWKPSVREALIHYLTQ